MTPDQIASNFALAAMADMDQPEQAAAATNLLMKTLPALRDHLSAQFELAGCDQETIFNGFRQLFKDALLSAGVTDPTEEISDEDILADDVSDEEEIEEENKPLIEESFATSVAQLRELAMGQIRDKGKFIPLDDIELPGDKKVKPIKKEEPAAARSSGAEMEAPKRRNVMGSLRK